VRALASQEQAEVHRGFELETSARSFSDGGIDTDSAVEQRAMEVALVAHEDSRLDEDEAHMKPPVLYTIESGAAQLQDKAVQSLTLTFAEFVDPFLLVTDLELLGMVAVSG